MIIRVIVFVLLGAIVNVAVAWGCAAWSVGANLYDVPGSPYPWPLTNSLDRQLFSQMHWRTTPDSSWVSGEIRGFGFQRRELIELSNNHGTGVRLGRTSSGWPLHTLESMDAFDAFYRYRWAWPVNIEVDIGGPIPMERPLPLRPRPFRFAINTIFYAGVLWLLFCGRFALRRFIRAKRGRCLHCGYDLCGQVAADAKEIRCPECGRSAFHR